MKIFTYFIFFMLTHNSFSNDKLQKNQFAHFYEVEQKRFSKNTEGIIKDHKTGLEWLEGPDKPTSWLMAHNWIKSLNGNWRLPTTKELSQKVWFRSILELLLKTIHENTKKFIHILLLHSLQERFSTLL